MVLILYKRLFGLWLCDFNIQKNKVSIYKEFKICFYILGIYFFVSFYSYFYIIQIFVLDSVNYFLVVQNGVVDNLV